MKVQEKEPLSPHFKQYQAIETVFFMSNFSYLFHFLLVFGCFCCKVKPRVKTEKA